MPYRDPDRRRQYERERARRRTADRLSRGLCPRCGRNPPESDRSQCASCNRKRRAADRARAAKRRAAGVKRVRDPEARKAEYRRARERAGERLSRGLCAQCGLNAHEPDRRLCSACGEKRRAAERERCRRARRAGLKYGGKRLDARRRQGRRRSRKRRHARTLAGLCVRCGRNTAVQGGASCEPCLEKRRVLDREQYRYRRGAGCCGRCGVHTFEGAPVCGPCAVIGARRQPKKNAAARRRYAERRARWICTACGRKPSFGASRCEDCSKLEYERSGHVRGIPDWEPACTVIDAVSGDTLGTWDRWEDAVASLSFAGMSLDDVELLSETSPLHAMTGWG